MKTSLFFIVMLLSGIDIAEAKDLGSFDCLATTIYFESRGEPVPGQFAVGSVVLNRVLSQQYANTVCEVVYQPYQFSWTLLKQPVIRDKKAWHTAQQIAWILLNKEFKSNVGNSLDYHSKKVNPKLARHYTKASVIGQHIFYWRKS